MNEDSERGARLRALAIDKLDNRYKPAKSYEAVEAEALGKGAIVGIVRHRCDAISASNGGQASSATTNQQPRAKRARRVGADHEALPFGPPRRRRKEFLATGGHQITCYGAVDE